jgi:hypothetical protein
MKWVPVEYSRDSEGYEINPDRDISLKGHIEYWEEEYICYTSEK